MIAPKHIAVIMDGNGRWAKRRFLPRIAGHKAGVEAVRRIIQGCMERKIEVLTLFAFSSENWQRPADEVSELMRLFLLVLQNEINKLHENNIQLKIIGDISRFNSALQEHIRLGEEKTSHNTGLKLRIAANYGGRWDLTQAVKNIARHVKQGIINIDQITDSTVAQYLSTYDVVDPDLLIRTSGEARISNFLLWQFAYTEIYLTDKLWPDFNEHELDKALHFFSERERRFGRLVTS